MFHGQLRRCLLYYWGLISFVHHFSYAVLWHLDYFQYETSWKPTNSLSQVRFVNIDFNWVFKLNNTNNKMNLLMISAILLCKKIIKLSKDNTYQTNFSLQSINLSCISLSSISHYFCYFISAIYLCVFWKTLFHWFNYYSSENLAEDTN